MNVYADHAATTPMRACAKEAMLEALEDFGNPSSIHSAGRLAAVRLESARKEVAELLSKLTGTEIDKKKVELPSAIKEFGTYDATVRLYAGISASFKVKVEEL